MAKQCTCETPSVRPREYVCTACGGVARGPARGEWTELDAWATPASTYPRGEQGRARIVDHHYPRGVYHCYMQRGFEYYRATRRLPITGLEIDGECWMVDDPPHWWAMEDHASYYRGHVLCAGLGLGLIVHTLDANPDVEHITVVERERDVIELVGPRVPNRKLDIIEADFFALDSASIRPDGVLFDLFVGNAQQLLGQAVHVVADILCKWDHPGFAVRVHGFANPMLEDIARATLEAGQHAIPREAQ